LKFSRFCQFLRFYKNYQNVIYCFCQFWDFHKLSNSLRFSRNYGRNFKFEVFKNFFSNFQLCLNGSGSLNCSSPFSQQFPKNTKGSQNCELTATTINAVTKKEQNTPPFFERESVRVIRSRSASKCSNRIYFLEKVYKFIKKIVLYVLYKIGKMWEMTRKKCEKI